MRDILIVGAGQAGLHLAIGLLQHGYDVTVVSNRTPESIRDGRVMSGQAMFGTAQAHERRLGLDWWAEVCPPIDGIALTVPSPEGGKALDWAARLHVPARSVDQRLKMPAWLGEFERLGGKLVLHDATPEDLEGYAARYDLVLVAAGKGQIASLFERDPERSPYAAPQRARGGHLRQRPGSPPRALGGLLQPASRRGRVLRLPRAHAHRPLRDHGVRGRAGRSHGLLGRRARPGRAPGAQPPDPGDVLPVGGRALRRDRAHRRQRGPDRRFAPTVRRPVAVLPSGAPVLGVADVVVLNDPITGQGSNNAAKCADTYLRAIVERGGQPFDADWMRRTFDLFWAQAQHVTNWTNALLAPAEPHHLALLGAAGERPEIASRFVNGFDDPADYADWFMDAARAEAYLSRVAA
ncbi:hypothetical protein GCM10020220_061040 [Nonomuraea rubra]